MPDGPYAMADLAGDALALLDRLGIEQSAGTSSLAPTVVGRWFTPDWADRHQEVVDRTRQMVCDTPDEGYAACCEAIAEWDGRELLGRITAPTLVIAGSQDPSTPVTPHAEAIATGIPGAKLEVLDTAHLVTVEQAKQANDLLTEHLVNRW